MRNDKVYDDGDEFYSYEKWVESMKCPHDGEQLTYWEGTIDQDEMGNDILGFWFTCPKCDYQTEVETL